MSPLRSHEWLEGRGQQSTVGEGPCVRGWGCDVCMDSVCVYVRVPVVEHVCKCAHVLGRCMILHFWEWLVSLSLSELRMWVNVGMVCVCVCLWTCRQLQRMRGKWRGWIPTVGHEKPPGSKSGTRMLQGWWANHILGPWCGKPQGWHCFQPEPGLIAMCLSRPKVSLSGFLLSEQCLKASSYFFMPWNPLLNRESPSAGPSLLCKGGDGVVAFQKAA